MVDGFPNKDLKIFLIYKRQKDNWLLINADGIYSFTSITENEIPPTYPLVFNSVNLVHRSKELEYEGIYTVNFTDILRLTEDNNCN